MNFASTDWVMSLDPQWYSTIFVDVFVAGQFLAALALVTALLACSDERTGGRRARFRRKAFTDLGNLLLAFVIFWTYVAFSQFLIIWSGNLPKEISWYLERSRGGWQWFATRSSPLQFFLPFLLLLSRDAKRKQERLAGICAAHLAGERARTISGWSRLPFIPMAFCVHWLEARSSSRSAGFGSRSFFIF